MGKYAPLGDFLRRQTVSRVPMTFAEIEKIVGTKLPRSQQYPAWWSNNPWNNVMTQVWLDAGFETESVDVEQRKLVFHRVRERMPSEAASKDAAGEPPLFGWMKGTVTVAPGIDLSEPADPDWGEQAWGEQVWGDRG
ncbi:MAG: hypothetical protein AB7K35_00395 [Pseudorhodoplanes sp.]